MLKLGGVPEHFNFPILKTLEENEEFQRQIKWINIPEGTGEMVKKLNSKEVDAALLLTEGATKAINLGADFYIAQVYVSSPLCWGVHQLPNAIIQPEPNPQKPILISRFGSGSHLMSYVWLAQHNLKPSEDNFKVIGTLDKALAHFQAKNSGYFLWEKYTTMPYVESCIISRTEEIYTPWPCFVLCLRNGLSTEEKNSLLNQFFPTVEALAKRSKLIPSASINTIAERYNLKPEKVNEWFTQTTWFGNCDLEAEILKAEQFLIQAGQLEKKITPSAYFGK